MHLPACLQGMDPAEASIMQQAMAQAFDPLALGGAGGAYGARMYETAQSAGESPEGAAHQGLYMTRLLLVAVLLRQPCCCQLPASPLGQQPSETSGACCRCRPARWRIWSCCSRKTRRRATKR